MRAGGRGQGQIPPSPCFVSPKELFYEDRHFHEGCFRCCRCQRSLADEPFTCQDSELLCNECYCTAFSSQCSACGETVMPGMSQGLILGSGTAIRAGSLRLPGSYSHEVWCG